MIGFKKVFYTKIVLLVVTIAFFLNSTLYGIALPDKSQVRVPLQMSSKEDEEGFQKTMDRTRFLKVLLLVAGGVAVSGIGLSLHVDFSGKSLPNTDIFKRLESEFPDIEIEGLLEVDESELYARQLHDVLILVKEYYPRLLKRVKIIIFQKAVRQPSGFFKLTSSSFSDIDNGIISLGSNHIYGTTSRTYAGIDSLQASPNRAKSRLASIFLHELSHFVTSDVLKNMPEVVSYYSNLLNDYNSWLEPLPCMPVGYTEFLTEDIATYFYTGKVLYQWRVISSADIEYLGLKKDRFIIDISDSAEKRREILEKVRKKWSSGDKLEEIDNPSSRRGFFLGFRNRARQGL